MPHARTLRVALLAPILAVLAGCGAPAPASEAQAEAQAQAHAQAGADTPPAESRVVLVTGSTDGLGREVALEMAAEGAHVIIHGRNPERGAEVVEAIQAAGVGSARFYAADFAELREVQALAEAILRDYDRLDLLVNNAGVGPGAPGHERVITPDGHELRFQVNYLAHYHLTRELLPLLVAGAPSRIVSVTSRNQQALDFEDLRMDRGYAGGVAYGRSKLAQVLHVQDLAEALADRGVRVYAVHPAPAMATGLVLETGATPQSTVAQGVASVLQAIRTASHPTGTYFFELSPQPAHDQAYDADARRRLREMSDAFVAEALARR